MIKHADGFHWYDCRGATPEPKHDADLRLARKELLYPSITTVDKASFPNEGLVRYKQDQLACAAYRLPRMEHETEETYCNRIYQESLEHSKKAADFGKEIHDAIEHYPQMPLDPKLSPWMDKFGSWYDKNIGEVLFREKILVDHDLGLAGRCDFIGIHKVTGAIIVPDWKTQGVKRNPKGKKLPGFYDSWIRQLSFYAVAYAKEAGLFPHSIPTVMSVVIDSNEPDDPFVNVWSSPELAAAYQDVCIGSYHYFKSRGFWPHRDKLPAIKLSVPQPFQNYEQ